MENFNNQLLNDTWAAKLDLKEMVTSFGAHLKESEKDAIIYFLLHFVLYSKNSNQAITKYHHIASLLNYDTNRIEFNEDTSVSDKFISKGDALNWLLNIDEASKDIFEMLVKMIITSNLHYSHGEQFYFNNLINKAELTGMHEDEKTNNWLLSFCDTDTEDVFKDLFDKIKKDEEKKDK